MKSLKALFEWSFAHKLKSAAFTIAIVFTACWMLDPDQNLRMQAVSLFLSMIAILITVYEIDNKKG